MNCTGGDAHAEKTLTPLDEETAMTPFAVNRALLRSPHFAPGEDPVCSSISFAHSRMTAIRFCATVSVTESITSAMARSSTGVRGGSLFGVNSSTGGPYMTGL